MTYTNFNAFPDLMAKYEGPEGVVLAGRISEVVYDHQGCYVDCPGGKTFRTVRDEDVIQPLKINVGDYWIVVLDANGLKGVKQFTMPAEAFDGIYERRAP